MKRSGWECCIVAATGPSLTQEIADQCHGRRVIAVNDAWMLLPFADVLYACDERWWEAKGPKHFSGELWSSHQLDPNIPNDKRACAKKFGLRLVEGRDAPGFCAEPGVIHYGGNSGFQAVNLAIQFGARHVTMIGFDMQDVNGNEHFFGAHPSNFPPRAYQVFINAFTDAAKRLPAGVRIVNATPGTALKCFPVMSIDEAIRDSCLHRDWTIAHAAAG